LRVFFSTGEPSGEYHAVELAQAMRRLDAARPESEGLQLEGIGSQRMRAAGFKVVVETRGWASLGPLEALAKIPRLLATMLLVSLRLRLRPPALIVLVDFGAFNLRFARQLRRIGYRGPIVYYIPPGAWLDRPRQAKMVAAATIPLTIFAHQRDFYERLGLRVEFFGHPLVSLIAPRPQRPAPAADGGTIALLPGSRLAEIERHMPPLLAAGRILAAERPRLQIVIGAATPELRARIQAHLPSAQTPRVRIVDGARAALEDADAAAIASGTAVLEAALLGVASVVLYITSPAQARIAERIYRRIRGRWFCLPNLILSRGVVAELWQGAATPAALATELRALLRDPSAQLRELSGLRAALGPADALQRAARFVLGAAAPA
jgi:lipid-A-disaccharide synthase